MSFLFPVVGLMSLNAALFAADDNKSHFDICVLYVAMVTAGYRMKLVINVEPNSISKTRFLRTTTSQSEQSIHPAHGILFCIIYII